MKIIILGLHVAQGFSRYKKKRPIPPTEPVPSKQFA